MYMYIDRLRFIEAAHIIWPRAPAADSFLHPAKRTRISSAARFRGQGTYYYYH